jgi:hypothetical protein
MGTIFTINKDPFRHSNNQLDFVMQFQCVYYEVGTDDLCFLQVTVKLRGVKLHKIFKTFRLINAEKKLSYGNFQHTPNSMVILQGL